MGVQITELLVRREISISELKGRVVAVDAFNHLYQFLSTIRQRDGSLFTDSGGNVTSHLIGLLSRTSALLRSGLRLVYVFDGAVPELKHAEVRRRSLIKEDSERLYREAESASDIEGMRKYASRTSRLTPEMVGEAKRLLSALGVPCVDAPSEGEAQAAYMAKRGDCYAVASQDADCLLFGAPLLVRNLSVTGRKKLAGKIAFQDVSPEIISLKDNLSNLGISHEQLICLAMLVGTDYSSGGVKGVGPKTALKLVREYKLPERIFEAAKWNENVSVPWQDVFSLISNMPVTERYEIKFSGVDRDSVLKLLCDVHGFSADRVESSLKGLGEVSQRGLMDFG